MTKPGRASKDRKLRNGVYCWPHLELNRGPAHLPASARRRRADRRRREESALEDRRPASSALVFKLCHLSAGPTGVLQGRESRSAVTTLEPFLGPSLTDPTTAKELKINSSGVLLFTVSQLVCPLHTSVHARALAHLKMPDGLRVGYTSDSSGPLHPFNSKDPVIVF